MTRKITLGIYPVLVLGLINCGPVFMRGTLISKVHEPKNTWVQMMPIVTGKTTSLIPIVLEDNEDWVFVIENSTGSGKKLSQRRIYVNQEVFSKHQEGDWIEVETLGEFKDKDKPVQSEKPLVKEY